MGLPASTLAGLHVYFFLKIARKANSGDYGAFITASEWLDVNYGQLVRDLFVDRLGGLSVHVIDQKAEPFPGTATTGANHNFHGERQSSVNSVRPNFATVEPGQIKRRTARFARTSCGRKAMVAFHSSPTRNTGRIRGTR